MLWIVEVAGALPHILKIDKMGNKENFETILAKKEKNARKLVKKPAYCTKLPTFFLGPDIIDST